MDAEPGMTIVILDDHPAVVDGVRSWCAAARPPIVVVDTGSRLAVAVTGVGRGADVVVFDLQLEPGPPAFRELQRLVDDGRRVVVYSQHADSDTIMRCLEIGAATYLIKAEGPEHLIAAIQAVGDDLPYTPPMLSGAMATDRRPDRPVLSEREREVLLAWFESDSKNLVAQRFHLSTSTVDTYINRVRVKYADAGRPATTKAALVARALQDGLVDLAGL
ncbi:MAG: response regulator transcription factor [Pseudonocardiaceae bacterium]